METEKVNPDLKAVQLRLKRVKEQRDKLIKKKKTPNTRKLIKEFNQRISRLKEWEQEFKN